MSKKKGVREGGTASGEASKSRKGPNSAIEPTPEEIRAACLEFQEGWDDREHHRRAGTVLPGEPLNEWNVPVVRVGS